MAKGVHMGSVIVVCVTSVVALVGVLASNSKSRDRHLFMP